MNKVLYFNFVAVVVKAGELSPTLWEIPIPLAGGV